MSYFDKTERFLTVSWTFHLWFGFRFQNRRQTIVNARLLHCGRISSIPLAFFMRLYFYHLAHFGVKTKEKSAKTTSSLLHGQYNFLFLAQNVFLIHRELSVAFEIINTLHFIGLSISINLYIPRNLKFLQKWISRFFTLFGHRALASVGPAVGNNTL